MKEVGLLQALVPQKGPVVLQSQKFLTSGNQGMHFAMSSAQLIFFFFFLQLTKGGVGRPLLGRNGSSPVLVVPKTWIWVAGPMVALPELDTVGLLTNTVSGDPVLEVAALPPLEAAAWAKVLHVAVSMPPG